MMSNNFKIVKVDYNYCNYLRKYDNRVSYNAGIKELRPFIGVLFMVEDKEYFAPLSSPKQKHIKMKNNIDIIKIDNGNLGVINFNNMIPVTNNNYILFDLYGESNSESERKRKELLKSQLLWLNKNNKIIRNKAIKLYTLYKEERLPKNVRDRCCNFILLEEKSKEYNKVLV